MTAERYAIVDIETTGGKADTHRITEIAIILHDGERILDTWETLVNPETWIPYGITELTGISQEMVQDAPKFYEIARKILELTEGAILVAHNAFFDYSFLREEFARLGYTFSRRQLCTVRLGRKTFPGLHSYSLDNLIAWMGITVTQRHRAMGDALATAELFRRIMAQQGGAQQAMAMLQMGLKNNRLPEHFDMERLLQLPEACGVYYFHGKAGEVLYVGKSLNIRKRIAEHFANKTEKTRKLRELTYDITAEVTGSELVALLLESAEIKRLRPSVNRAQRQQSFPYAIYVYTDAEGFLRFEAERLSIVQRKKLKVLAEFPSMQAARSRLEWASEQFELCRRLTGLHAGKGACFQFHLQKCKGACVGRESPESYNERALATSEALQVGFEEDFLLLERGRSPQEKAVVLVEGGHFAGYGYVSAQEGWSAQELRQAIRPMKGTPEATRIIQAYLHRKPAGLRKIPLHGASE